MILETQILTAVINYLSEKCAPFAKITTGGISPSGGISAEIAPGYARSTYLDGGVFQRLPILLVIRHGKHQTAMETAFAFAKAAREAHEIHTNVAGINVGTAPEFVQRSGADYIYSLIINVDYMA
jgi:aconitase A